MYVDRAEYLVKLAASLELDVMILMGVACGTLTAEQALRHVGDKALPDPASQPPAKAVAKRKVVDIDADAAKFAVTPGYLGSANRALVLLISDSGAGQTDMAAVLRNHADVGGLVATSLPMGTILAERYRPELIFLELDVAGAAGFEACRALSTMVSRSRRRSRIVAGSVSLTDTIQTAALMAGAGSFTSVPFGQTFFRVELERLEERLGPRRMG